MDREDRRRYFVVGSVILEVVTPLFHRRLEKDYQNYGFGSLQAFINHQPVIHILFHLRHKNVWCCTDQSNCRNNMTLPLNYSQWDLLYSENPGPGQRHHCHCKYKANPVQLVDLDITLASLVLLNCCNLPQGEQNLIMALRTFKNNYLSHNSKGCITQAEYNTLWPDLENFVLQLDPSKQDELTRIENRPLDEPLCHKYATLLLDIHKIMEEVNTSLQENNALLHGLKTSVLENMATARENHDLLHGINTSILENTTEIQCLLQQLLSHVGEGNVSGLSAVPVKLQSQQRKPYKLGQSIFHLHHQIELKSVVNVKLVVGIVDGVMMDDGRFVLCQPCLLKLLICNTNGSQVDSIPVQGGPRRVTAVNDSTVAVTLVGSSCIEMYDINHKIKLNSIPVPEMFWRCGITTINNKLVVGCKEKLKFIDHQTGEVVLTTHTDDHFPYYIHASGDRIFYCSDNRLTCYYYSGDKVLTKTLPSEPRRITSLQDGSLYVLCKDGTVQHVSSDVQHFKPVTTMALTKQQNIITAFSYNTKQRKLITCQFNGLAKVFNEIK